MPRALVSLAFLTALLLPQAAPAKGKARRHLKRAATSAAKRAQSWYGSRSRRSLFEKGSRLRSGRKTLSERGAMRATLSFAPPSYQALFKGREERFLNRLYAARPAYPHFAGVPLPVKSAKLIAVHAHRDAVSVEAEVSYLARGLKTTRVERFVWIRAGRGLVLSLREAEGGKHKDGRDEVGPVASKELFKSGLATSTKSGIQAALAVEALIKGFPTPQEERKRNQEQKRKRQEAKRKGHKPPEAEGWKGKLAKDLAKISLADFGELVEAGNDEGGSFAIVRCGFLRLRVRLEAAAAGVAAQIKPGTQVLVTGELSALPHPRNPWREVNYKRAGYPVRWRCLQVDLKGSVTELK